MSPSGKGGTSAIRRRAMHSLSLLRHLDICAGFPEREHVFPSLLDVLCDMSRR
jgi:hypothetical protein